MGRLQDLRDFTVQIRHAETDEMAGTGVAISMAGEIVTCKHVYEDALANPDVDFETGEVGVHFAQAKGQQKGRRAKLDRYFSDSDDDVVVLKLIGKSPLAPEQMPELGMAENSVGNEFSSYGYRKLGAFRAGIATGKIAGVVEPPIDENWLTDPLQLRSGEIDQGMSGAAVLDTERNLVVGVVYLKYLADQDGIDQDTAWAVDAKVLTFDPLNVQLYEGESLELKESATPTADVMAKAKESYVPDLSLTAHPAPSPPEEWVGREELLKQLNIDWNDADTKVVGLIGFGGEGKSSLAAKWIADLLNDQDQEQPDGLFWWSFYDRRSVDEFFEAALTYLSRNNEDLLQACKSPNARAHLIAGMLHGGAYLFVLDGLEVMQEPEGDEYGEFTSEDLRQFLEYFSAPANSSFCLITSRAPVFDLMDHTTYVHRDINRLSDSEGCALLGIVGVKGDDSDLIDAVNLWDGHAITLSLIGAYLAEVHGGDIAHLNDIESPTADEPRYERVHRILRQYDKHLSEVDRAFLQFFSAFRTPVAETAFDTVFRTKTSDNALNAPIADLSDSEFKALINQLQTYRMLRHDPVENYYTTHPLIRGHYFTLLSKGDSDQTQNTHEQIKDYYLSVAGDTPDYPTLDDLAPLIEVVHHCCQAGAYDEAHVIRRDRIYQGNRRVLVNELGGYDTALALALEFFPDEDTSQEPQVSDPKYRSWILNEVGLCLTGLGHLSESAALIERANRMDEETDEWRQASRGYQNLSGLYAGLGRLAESAQAATEALKLARRAKHRQEEANALARIALASSLLGEADEADASYARQLEIETTLHPGLEFLYSIDGVEQADHLRRVNEVDYARRITKANLELCERNRFIKSVSQCHRVLGDLAAVGSDHEQTGPHYDAALKIARTITMQSVLIEALLARGRWQAKLAAETGENAELQQAFSDLREAFGYAYKGGYRIHEADIRVALAWAHLASKKPDIARQEAAHALNMSEEMGYYWGKVDAQELLDKL